MKYELSSIFKGKVVIVGIGNVLKADDAFGPELVRKLMEETGLFCIDAGTTPENYSGKIARENPDTIILLDAAHIGKNPGEWAIMEEDEIVKSGFTTHDLSPAVFIGYLKEKTNADIYLLGVEPENLSLGGEMSRSVKETIEKIVREMKEFYHA